MEPKELVERPAVGITELAEGSIVLVEGPTVGTMELAEGSLEMFEGPTVLMNKQGELPEGS